MESRTKLLIVRFNLEICHKNSQGYAISKTVHLSLRDFFCCCSRAVVEEISLCDKLFVLGIHCTMYIAVKITYVRHEHTTQFASKFYK